MRKIIVAFSLLIVVFTFSIFAQQKTVINNQKAKTMLLGKHRLALQWISWDYFGTAIVTQRAGVFYLKGTHNQRGGKDFLRIDGVITEINAKDFKFDGTITTRISHINEGKTCERTGAMTFKITGSRRYWRLQEMNNPCEEVVDYVDIFFVKNY